MEFLKQIANSYEAETKNGALNPSKKIQELAKKNGAVIVYGSSDDLCEFRGAVSDEVGAYLGGEVFFTKNGLLENQCENFDCPHFKETTKKATCMEIVCDVISEEKEKPYFCYKIDVPHATFKIIEGDFCFCEGIVFYLKDCAES